MKTLIAVFMSLALCACANDTSSRRLVEVGESCAALGRGIQVAGWQDGQPAYFVDSYAGADIQVKCW